MPRKKDLNKEARDKEKKNVKVSPVDLDAAFDALEDTLEINADGPPPFEVNEDDEADINIRASGSAEFIALQRELADIREARKKLTSDMDAPELDKDERDTLKARGTLLDSRERSAREELKLFHKSELTSLGQIRKVRIVIESYLTGQEDEVKGRL